MSSGLGTKLGLCPTTFTAPKTQWCVTGGPATHPAARAGGRTFLDDQPCEALSDQLLARSY